MPFLHLQRLSFSYFNQNAVGYIHSRVMSDTGRIGSLVSWTLMDSVWHLSYLIGSIVVMLVINARLALMVMVILPLIVVLFSFFQNRLIRAAKNIRGGMPVGEAALDSGFSDYSAFYRAFRKQFGASPGRIRSAPEELSGAVTIRTRESDG